MTRFTPEEAAALVGRRVQCVRSMNTGAMLFVFTPIEAGAMGEVVDSYYSEDDAQVVVDVCLVGLSGQYKFTKERWDEHFQLA